MRERADYEQYENMMTLATVPEELLKVSDFYPGADFSGANLAGYRFARMNLYGVNFEGANLKGAVFAASELKKVNFQHADLTDAIFTNSEIEDSDFRYAKLVRADFSLASIGKKSFFTGADMTQVFFLRVYEMENAKGCCWPSKTDCEGAYVDAKSLKIFNELFKYSEFTMINYVDWNKAWVDVSEWYKKNNREKRRQLAKVSQSMSYDEFHQKFDYVEDNFTPGLLKEYRGGSNVNIPQWVTSIAERDSVLTSLLGPRSIFSGNREIKHLTTPSSLKALRESAFADCIFLETVELGEGLTYIGNSAFENCKNLRKIIIPSTVEVISLAEDDPFALHSPRGAFEGCESLEEIVYTPKAHVYPACFKGSLWYERYLEERERIRIEELKKSRLDAGRCPDCDEKLSFLGRKCPKCGKKYPR